MRDRAWIAEEERLWNAVMHPPRRKAVPHSLAGPARQRVLEDIRKQQEKDFAAGWAALRRYLEH